MPSRHETNVCQAKPGDASYNPEMKTYVWHCTCGDGSKTAALSEFGAEQVAAAHKTSKGRWI